MDNLTPAMKQYMKVKHDNPDCLVLFRMGDFYETFYDDAILASKVLNITLTSRGKDEKKAPLAGIPYHALNTYLSKLLKENIKVAIVEQTEDPKKAKGLVKRDLLRIITPGTIVEEDFLDPSRNNYLACVFKGEGFGLSYVDISTGEFKATSIKDDEAFISEMSKISPSEVLIPSNDEGLFLILNKFFITKRPVHTFFVDNAKINIKTHMPSTLNIIESKGDVISSVGALLDYIKDTQKTTLSYINDIILYSSEEYMTIDQSTQRNLELLTNILQNSKEHTLISVIDRTCTSAGARELKRWIIRPLLDIGKIRQRLDAVEKLKDDRLLRHELKEVLSGLYDIERLISRVSFGTAMPKDMLSLKLSLQRLPSIRFLLEEQEELLSNLSDFPDLNYVCELLESSIKEDCGMSIREGGIIKEGYDHELDELHNVRKSATSIIREIESKEIERTGIKSLKVRYNKVFGYFIEVTNKNLDLVPSDYIRKQTQVNCERFITEELKDIEEKILNAEERIREMEYSLFMDIINKVSQYATDIQQVAKNVSVIDVLSSLADVADDRSYAKPELNDSFDMEIIDGRHPVIEVYEPDFVANSCSFDVSKRMMIITGPNMAGKSTYMRQNALIILMAHIGSFVPASSAKIPLTDRIFTRVGAYDDLAHGQSTFMVEMVETANILKNATERSFIVLDEIGRGTSTFDGVSIAWSVAEYLHDRVRAKTMFATHYHVLNTLKDGFSGIENYNIAVLEDKDRIVFLRKIVQGATDKSYGIHVAGLAGVPKPVLERARRIQKMLEGKDKMGRKLNGENLSDYDNQKTLFDMAGRWV